MSYKVSELNGIKTYNLGAGKTLVQFHEQSKKEQKSLRYNNDYRNRIELIQDFEFKISCQQVKMTQDQNHILASGIYAPQLKIFDLKDLSMKCLRGMDSEVISLLSLSEDYSKFVVGCQDRGIEFHAQYGKHFKTRVPKNIRKMVYNKFSCDLIIGANSNEIYRLNLEEGVFMQPLQSSNGSVEALCYSDYLDLLITGGELGVLDIYDYRQRKKAFSIQQPHPITCVESQNQGLQYLIGYEQGLVQLMDIRYNNTPILDIQHQYRMPINTLEFHQKTKTIISTDSKLIKITQTESATNFTSIEPGYKINHSTLVKDSGLFLVAGETQRIGQFFVPALDNAPKWCPFLENITEEMEESNTHYIYDEYKFLTLQDVEALGAVGLIGGKMLKNYMQGYLMHLKLYNKLKMVSDPFQYQQYRKEQIKEKLNESMAQRIIIKQKKKKINQEYFEELNKKKQKSGDVDLKSAINEDSRFNKLFTEKKYQIDKSDTNYILNNPSRNKQKKQQLSDDEQSQKDEKEFKNIKKEKQEQSFEKKLNILSKKTRKIQKKDRFFK